MVYKSVIMTVVQRRRLFWRRWEQQQPSSSAWHSAALISLHAASSAVPDELLVRVTWPVSHRAQVRSQVQCLPHSARVPEKPGASSRQGWCPPRPHSFSSCCHFSLCFRSFLSIQEGDAAWKVVVWGRILSCFSSFDQRRSSASSSSAL